LPNQCTVNPQPTLVLENDTLVIDVVARQTSGYCMQILGQDYEQAFDIASLRELLPAMGLDENGTYAVKTADGRLDLSVDFSAFYYVQPYPTKAAVATFTPVLKSNSVQLSAEEIF